MGARYTPSIAAVDTAGVAHNICLHMCIHLHLRMLIEIFIL